MQFQKFLRVFKDPYWALGVIIRRFSGLIKDDKTFIKWEFFSGMKRFPELETPRSYNDKLQWLKLNAIHPEYSQYVDKVEVKKYVASKIGVEHIIPTLGVWHRWEDIDFDSLPDRFVLKTSHDSGGVAICLEKSEKSLRRAEKKISKSLKNNYYFEHREYPYKNITPRILAEPYLIDESGSELKDYKFFCFDGEPKFLFVATDRQSNVCFDFFDLDFNHLPFTQGHPNSTKSINKPENFDQMIDLARRLSAEFPHVRVDLYNINGAIYFGELTFFHFSGNVPFVPEEWDFRVGDMLRLPKE